MIDLHLLISLIFPIGYFLFFMWLISPFYALRKQPWIDIKDKIISLAIKRGVIFILVTIAVLTLGSAYRPKNTIKTQNSNFGQTRNSTEIKSEAPRYETFNKKVQDLEESRSIKENELKNLIEQP